MSKQKSKEIESEISEEPVERWFEAGDYRNALSLKDVLSRVSVHLRNPDTTTKVMVGTDSHASSSNYHFVTVICVLNVGKGGTYYLKSCLEPRKVFNGSQKMRLQEEVTKSLIVAFEVEKELLMKPEVHIDASPAYKKEFSSSFSDLLKGYVLSSGFDAILKPDSFVSNCVADKHTRQKIRGKKNKKLAKLKGKNG